MKLIGLGGLKQSGKSTIAHQLELLAAQNNVQVLRHSFAEPLKAMSHALLRSVGYLSGDIVHFETNKTEPIDKIGGYSMRQIQQTLGTEWGRDCLHREFWVDIGRAKIRPDSRSLHIFDDVRFETECVMIQELGGTVIQLQRTGVTAGDGHRSEAMDYVPDLIVANDDEPMRVAQHIWRLTQ